MFARFLIAYGHYVGVIAVGSHAKNVLHRTNNAYSANRFDGALLREVRSCECSTFRAYGKSRIALHSLRRLPRNQFDGALGSFDCYLGSMLNPVQQTLLLGMLLSVSIAHGNAHEVLSNRHHLTGCGMHSVPVIYPHTTASTVRLGLPAEIDGGQSIVAIYGEERAGVLRPSRRGLVGRETSGGVVLAPTPSHGC